MKALVDANRRITTREIRLSLNLSNSTVYDHLKGLELSRCSMYGFPCNDVYYWFHVYIGQEKDPLLQRIITGVENWVVCNNVKHKTSWSKKDDPAQTIS